MRAVNKLKPIKRGNAWHIHGIVIHDDGQTKTKVRETTGKPIASTTEAEAWALVQKRFDEISCGVTGGVTIDVLAKKYLSARSFGKSPRQTIERFAQDLGHLLTSQLTAEQYYNWAYQNVQGEFGRLKPSAITNKMTTTRAFMRHFIALGYKFDDKVMEVAKPKFRNNKASFFEADERDRFIDEFPGTFRPIVKFLFGAGPRWSEAQRLKRSDLSIEDGAVYAVFRNRKSADQTWQERKVPLNQMAVDALPRGWMEMDDDDLIFTIGGEAIAYGQINYRWNQSKQLMGIENAELTPHTARHTFATLLLFDDGVDLSFVAQLIGDTITICEKRYIHARPEKAANALKRAGVLGEHKTITSVAPLKEAPRHAPEYGKIPNILGSKHLRKDSTSVGTTPRTSLTQV